MIIDFERKKIGTIRIEAHIVVYSNNYHARSAANAETDFEGSNTSREF